MNKVIKIVGIVLIMALVFCTCALCLVGCNSNKELIVEPNEEPEQVVESGFEIEYEDTPEFGLSVQEIDPEDYEDYGVSMAAESAYTLTATILPAETTNKDVRWTIAFENPSSTWATGKSVSSYVSLSNTGTTTCTLSCNAAFGEKIIVKATSMSNQDLSATCTLNYVKRVESVSLSLSGDAVTSMTGLLKSIKIGNSITVSYGVTYGVGTVTGTFNASYVVVNLTDGLYSACSDAVTSGSWVKSQLTRSMILSTSSSWTIGSSSGSMTTTVANVSCFISRTGDPGSGESQWTKAFYNWCYTNPSVKHATVYLEYDYKYGTYNPGLKESDSVDISFNAEYIGVIASSISLDNTTLDI